MKKSGILKTAQIALMSVFIALCAWITIPFPVPFTLQTFGVYLALTILGSRKGTCAITLYTLLGIAGVPVFSAFGSGVGYLLGPTGGYILGFILCGLFCTLAEVIFKKPLSPYVTLSIGTVLFYFSGTVWYVLSTHTRVSQGIILCTLPYVIPDTLKLITTVQIAKRLRKINVFNME